MNAAGSCGFVSRPQAADAGQGRAVDLPLGDTVERDRPIAMTMSAGTGEHFYGAIATIYVLLGRADLFVVFDTVTPMFQNLMDERRRRQSSRGQRHRSLVDLVGRKELHPEVEFRWLGI